MLRREEAPIAPTPTTSPDYPNDSGVWRGPLTTRYAGVLGEEPSREDLDFAIREANAYTADELINKMRKANRAWLRSSLQDVPLDFTESEADVPTQEVSPGQLSSRTERLSLAAERLSLALHIRRDEDQHPSVFGAKRKKN